MGKSGWAWTKEWLWVLLPLVLVIGWFYPIAGLSVFACMFGPIITAIRKGRLWCGNVCPRGFFLERFMGYAGRNRPVPAILGGKAARVTVLVVLMGMMALQMVKAWPDPTAIGFLLWRMVLMTLTIGIIMGLLYKPRAWCAICPVGTISAGMAKKDGYLGVSSSCKSCGLCIKACPMGLTPFKPDTTHADCLQCGKCVGKCPFGALSLGDPGVAGQTHCERNGYQC